MPNSRLSVRFWNLNSASLNSINRARITENTMELPLYPSDANDVNTGSNDSVVPCAYDVV